MKNKEYYDTANYRWHKNHPGRKAALEKQHRKEWGITDLHDQSLIKCSEKYVADEILPDYGFQVICITREKWGSTFPFDIIAKKNGKICGIEVCLTWSRYLKKNKLDFAKIFDMEIYVVHIRPDLSWCGIIKLHDKHFSSVRQPFKKWLKDKEKSNEGNVG